MTREDRNGNIEFLRFVFSVVILLHHAAIPIMPVQYGYLAVEFFFMLNGYYMAVSIFRKANGSSDTFDVIIGDMWRYTKRRALTILPYVIVSSFVGAGVLMYSFNQEITLQGSLRLFNDFFFLQSYGYPTESATGVIWYLSSMFFGIWLIYPLARAKTNLFSKYLAPMISIVCTGFLIKNFDGLNVPDTYVFGIVCTGNIRSVSMMSLGFCIYQIANAPSTQNMINAHKIKFSVLEFVLYFSAIYYTCLNKKNMGAYDSFFVLVIGIALCISLSGRTAAAKLLNNKLSNALGKFSVALFLNHFYWVRNIEVFFSRIGFEAEEAVMYLSGLIFSIVTALIVMILTDLIIKKIIPVKKITSNG